MTCGSKLGDADGRVTLACEPGADTEAKKRYHALKVPPSHHYIDISQSCHPRPPSRVNVMFSYPHIYNKAQMVINRTASANSPPDIVPSSHCLSHCRLSADTAICVFPRYSLRPPLAWSLSCPGRGHRLVLTLECGKNGESGLPVFFSFPAAHY